jgi:hypothetical protein
MGKAEARTTTGGLTTPVLKMELEETGLFEVTVITAPAIGRGLQQLQAGA